MTTSGTAAFAYNRDQIIRAALRKIGAIASGETPDAQTITDASDQLNIMVKAWNATGIHIWTETEATLFLQYNQNSYVLGSGSTDNATETYYSTTLSAAGASSATTLSLTSTANITAGDYIGIVLTAGTLHWTTVVSKTTTQVVITTGLASAAASASAVYNYTTKIVRPLRVVSARRYVYLSTIDAPMIPASRVDFRNLPNKTALGQVTQYFYDPRGGKNTQGVMWTWPTPSDVLSAIKFTWLRPIEDFNAAANTPDLPSEWIDALIWNLAVKMAPEYDCPPQRYQMLVREAEGSLDLAMGWDREPESIYFGPNFDQR